ncbi:O-acetyl-ADP-ribose deacetylase [Marixanthomonas spongiae]|uniref:O-acetyl-ADP-ribose deacetylase n=1 Tax=Marixanthomonas spongiae TaxID=2174845 RepID=A0A2U0I8D7_9FLAO|nr:O-acetyl-ADP-ribose deacetylase [Marixanthomonas spongiae]PVW17348.1 O-acetyl-ADP-ribose deacetylase [Marixanthomonas spongiae]
MDLKAIKGDITTIEADAIVNVANASLMGGGGVDGAIHRAGGPEILEECKKIVAKQGKCKTGEAVVTTAGKLPSNYVIHTVGPVWKGGNKDEVQKLANCYKNSLALAVENNCKTIAFPNISTGVYDFPKDKAAEIAVKTMKMFSERNNTIEKVVFVCFDEENFNLTKNEL